MNYKRNMFILIILATILMSLVACSQTVNNENSNSNVNDSVQSVTNSESSDINTLAVTTKLLSEDELFSNRDKEQETNLTGATKYEVVDNTEINITKEGVYVISGTASNVTINVEAGDEEKVQLVLDNLNISNEDKECIHVESADKVFVTTSSQSNLVYSASDTENATGAIFSRDDIVFNGNGALTIDSSYNGIVGKDDVKITGGTYNITSGKNGIRANDSICIVGGTINIEAGSDGLHAENSDDDSKGYIYINSCTINITAKDDAIHATSIAQVNGGTINVTAGEGVEGTFVQINGGTFTINGVDDGINAARKSSAYTPTFEMNDGYLTINMSQGDTDGIDSNGNIIINSGTIEVNGSSTFDYDGEAIKNGGTIIINGASTDTIPNQMIGGGMRDGKNIYNTYIRRNNYD